MRPRALVVTTVHWPDDTRIRERLIRTLAGDFDVVYLARTPGPSDTRGLEFRELEGGRLRRNLRALRLILASSWDVLVLHDPELVLSGVLARWVKRRAVVFDVHEDVVALPNTRDWVAPWMRKPLTSLASLVLRVAESSLNITLAEEGYGRRFASDHPVFPNYPDTSAFPPIEPVRRREAVYLGDSTVARGLDVALEACARLDLPIRLVGRVAEPIELKIREAKARVIANGPLPNRVALETVAAAGVGLAPLRDLPNYRYSQPTKLLEYLGVGVPVVASDLPGTRALVGDLEAVWLVPEGDPIALADAISEALSPSALQIAVAQVESIRTRFSWPDDQVRGFYKSLIIR